MHLEQRKSGAVTIVSLPQRLLSKDTDAVRNAIFELVDNGATKLIFDLAGVDFLDASGLSAIVSGWEAVTERGGEAVLLNPSPTVVRLIELIRLQRLFEIYTDEAAAVSRLSCSAGTVAIRAAVVVTAPRTVASGRRHTTTRSTVASHALARCQSVGVGSRR